MGGDRACLDGHAQGDAGGEHGGHVVKVREGEVCRATPAPTRRRRFISLQRVLARESLSLQEYISHTFALSDVIAITRKREILDEFEGMVHIFKSKDPLSGQQTPTGKTWAFVMDKVSLFPSTT